MNTTHLTHFFFKRQKGESVARMAANISSIVCMTRQEFEHIRDLPQKSIPVDIVWQPDRGMGPNLTFKDVVVVNQIGLPVLLNGTFNPRIGSTTFNFTVRGTGPICRVDVNGAVHKPVGRTHKHSLTQPEDSELNLPQAVARPDLVNKTPREIWEDLCQKANIEHTGQFNDPY